MKKFSVTGYKMTKNPETWEMEVSSELITCEVLCTKEHIDAIEGTASIKLECDWFEAVTIEKIN